MTKLRDALVESNPWWKQSFTADYKDRELYQHIVKYLPLPQIIAFTGLRRVGKTTIMHKIIEEYIKKKTAPQNILYFSFDEFRTIDITVILNEYQQLLEKNLRTEQHLILFDEIQKLEHWDEQIKRFYDTYGKHVKIIISGSESLFIKKQSKETLGGRLFEFTVHTLTFKEFLEFKDLSIQNPALYEKELMTLFNEYILIQGFPELVGIKDKEIIRKYIKESIVEKVIYRDIPALFKIKDISILQSIMNMMMEEPGQIIDLSELASELQISRQTLSTYLHYLQDSFLIRKLYNYSTNRRKIERKLKKYYPTILSVDLLFKQDNQSRSRAFEGILVNQLNAEYFWRDPYKNEVDVIKTDQKTMPIEIKFGKIETKNLVKFMNKFHLNEGRIISFDQERTQVTEGKKIIITPAYKFLLQKPETSS